MDFNVAIPQIAHIAPHVPAPSGFAREKAVADALNTAANTIVPGCNQAEDFTLPRDFEHTVECDAGIRGNLGRDRDLIHGAAIEKVFHDPKQVRCIDPEHRGTEAAAVIERDNELVRVFRLQAIHKMDLGSDRPLRTGGRLGDTLNNVLRGTDLIR